MNTDTIEAADILITELSEQAALLSESGVTALSSGHLAEAKLIISAIEQTQALRDQAGQLKAEIAALHSTLTPTIPLGNQSGVAPVVYHLEPTGRTHDRTDPAEMKAKKEQIIRKLEDKYNVRFHRRSAAIYRSDTNKIGIVCAMSKWHENNENYWYAYHSHQDEFLSTVGQGYLVLGMMDAQSTVILPLDILHQNLSKLNTTTAPDRRSYWHIHISRTADGGLSLLRARGELPLPLDRYIVRLSN
jgi:hypothetical protein